MAPNLLEQHINPSAANQKWAGDITYLWIDEGWVYLATMIDRYSRAVIGYLSPMDFEAQQVA